MLSRGHTPATRRAFTLIELLVSIGIIAVLLSLIVVGLARARDAAKRTVCVSNARQILVAINASIASSNARLPESRYLRSNNTYVTWRYHLAENGSLPNPEVWECPLHPEPRPRGEAGYASGAIRCVGDMAASYALNGHVLWRAGLTSDSARLADTTIRRPSHTILLAETNSYLSNLRVSPPNVANYFGAPTGPY
ncbi:MAG: type II secretion system protein, partial [Planctomycetota bacterium]